MPVVDRNRTFQFVNFIKKPALLLSPFLLTAPFLAGCAKSQDSTGLNRQQLATIRSQNQEIARLNQEVDQLLASRQDLAGTKKQLESKLRDEMRSGDMSVSMKDRGVVVTVLDRVLFDPGQAELKESASAGLEKVAQILQQEVPDNMVYIEGHTDNEPIRVSGWRSNWELSTARATEVIHYFVDQSGVDPRRLAATGFGEFHPVVANDSLEGREMNRRVEIVISPKKVMA